jgi:Protein of unknown function (DUF3025)
VTAPALPLIDWSRRWLAPYRQIGQQVSARMDEGASVAEALQKSCPLIELDAGPLRFVPASALPAGTAYESFVAATACVPTRDNLHDFFNGLVWLHEPALKRRLNTLQAAQIAERGVTSQRGPVRDALTLFDENAALLQAPRRLVDALRERDWHALFVARRDDWQHASLQLFGHALLEKLVTPRKPITAHVWLVDDIPLTAAHLATKPFLPLPVLGVPGWWPDNEAAAFYDDLAVFRPAHSLGRKPSIDR